MLSIVDSLTASRKAQRLSQQDLADRAGTSRMTVVRVEAAQDPRLSTVYELARALGLELMLVPKALSEEVQSFVRSGGKVLGQPMGASAPLSLASIASKEIASLRITMNERPQRLPLGGLTPAAGVHIVDLSQDTPSNLTMTLQQGDKKISISDEAKAKMRKLSAARGPK